ncbi:S-phase kinase-associated protein 2-like [Pararge aegeria]|uniref:S-phase kinase-associated protein 2-like n=1 Tax=Pararge aegeria TaxID=116150 RepID=UPI0019D081F8|nr:S-phase kinase-associated protein 2-like [Pararge aegeria]
MTIFDDNNQEDVLSNINVLPDELLLDIFKCLPLETLLSCENVCKRWNKLAQDPSVWKRIVLIYSGKPGQSEISEKNLDIITSHCEYILCLKIQYVYDYSVIKSLIDQCSNLLSLELVMCRVGKEFEHDILKWPKLRKFSLKNSILLMNNLDLLIRFDKFKELNYIALSEFGLNSDNCNTLLQCSHLSNIFIEKIKDLDLEFIKLLILSRQRLLKTLHIYGGNSVDNTVLQLLSQCPQLKDLAIIRCESLSDEGLISLTSLKKIDHLQIWNNINFSELCLLKTLGSPALLTLKSLSLSRIQNVTPVIVDLISEYYKNLKFLALYQCPRIINTDYERQLKSKFRNIDVVLF